MGEIGSPDVRSGVEQLSGLKEVDSENMEIVTADNPLLVYLVKGSKR